MAKIKNQDNSLEAFTRFDELEKSILDTFSQ